MKKLSVSLAFVGTVLISGAQAEIFHQNKALQHNLEGGHNNL